MRAGSCERVNFKREAGRSSCLIPHWPVRTLVAVQASASSRTIASLFGQLAISRNNSGMGGLVIFIIAMPGSEMSLLFSYRRSPLHPEQPRMEALELPRPSSLKLYGMKVALGSALLDTTA
jgi:hypothetical protein